MTAGAKQPRPTLAEKRLDYLDWYRSQLEAFQKATIGDAHEHQWQPGARKLAQVLDDERPELRRVYDEIGATLQPSQNKNGELLKKLSTVTREWKRADDEAKDRVATLKAYLADVRRLEGLEIPWLQARDRLAHAFGGAEDERLVLESAPQITELRDQLGEEQPTIERILNDVDCSLHACSLAIGAHHVVGYVATQITKAIGQYREWPATREQFVPVPTSGPAPRGEAAPQTNIAINNTVNVTTTQVLQQLEHAIKAAAPEEKKAAWLETVKEISGSLAGGAVTAVLDKLLKGGS